MRSETAKQTRDTDITVGSQRRALRELFLLRHVTPRAAPFERIRASRVPILLTRPHVDIVFIRRRLALLVAIPCQSQNRRTNADGAENDIRVQRARRFFSEHDRLGRALVVRPGHAVAEAEDLGIGIVLVVHGDVLASGEWVGWH
jgi:hypothetical protein